MQKIRIGPNTWVGDYSVIEGGANVILPYSHVNSETKWSKKKRKRVVHPEKNRLL